MSRRAAGAANVEELIEVAAHFKAKGSGIAVPAKQGNASTTLFSQLLFSDGGDYVTADRKAGSDQRRGGSRGGRL